MQVSEDIETFVLNFPYPEDGIHFKCPVCAASYKLYTSFTRHAEASHPGALSFSFTCSSCSRPFTSKRAASIHFSKVHGARPVCPATTTSEEGARIPCLYCDDIFPSNRSVGQHIRCQHASEASNDRANEVSTVVQRGWTDSEHNLFLDAVRRLGLASNTAIAAFVGSKTHRQVAVHKSIFLRNNPGWRLYHPPLSPSQRVREAMMFMESPPRSLAETIATHDALLSYIPSSSATQSPPVHDSSQQNDPVVLTSDQSSLMVGSDPSSPLSAGDSSTSLLSAVLTPYPIQSLSALLSAPLPLYDNRVINQSGDNLSLQVTSLDIAMQPWLSNLSPHMNSDPMSPTSTAQPSIVCSTPVGANYQDDSLSPSPPHVDDPVIYDTQTRQLFQDAEATLDLLRSNTTLIPLVMHASPSGPIPIQSSLSSLESQHSTIHHDIATPEVYTPTSQVPSPMPSVDSCEPSTQVTYDTKTRELLWEADATLDLLMAPLSPVMDGIATLTCQEQSESHRDETTPLPSHPAGALLITPKSSTILPYSGSSDWIMPGGVQERAHRPDSSDTPIMDVNTHRQESSVDLTSSNTPISIESSQGSAPALISTMPASPGTPILDESFSLRPTSLPCSPPILDEVTSPGTPILDEVTSPGTPILDEVTSPGTPLMDEPSSPAKSISSLVPTVREDSISVVGDSQSLENNLHAQTFLANLEAGNGHQNVDHTYHHRTQPCQSVPSSQDSPSHVRSKRLEMFMSESAGLLERHLNDNEWSCLELRLTSLLGDLLKTLGKRSARHPSTHWRRRMRINGARGMAHQAHSTQSGVQHHIQNHQAPASTSSVQPQIESSQNPPRNHHHNRRSRLDPARKIQRWYRENRKRCMRSILGEESVFCAIAPNILQDFFDRPSVELGPDVPQWLHNAPCDELASQDDELSYQISEDEVLAQLRRLPWQSSPGPDGVPYLIWKSVATNSAKFLSSIFNTCLINGKIPNDWKKSTTVLIPKSGDKSLPQNWRPISLQPTIYKIFAAVMAKRLAIWALDEGKISPVQKGFLPMEGCVEHSFSVQSLLEDSKRRRKNVRFLWLDLRNAFGSVPHNLIWRMLRTSGVPPKFLRLCKEIYSGNFQHIRCSRDEFTRDIPLRVGIKQGCPLSPLLFNFALEGILPRLMSLGHGYQLNSGASISCLAYADDLCLISETKEGLQSQLDELLTFTSWAGLNFNVEKCGCLSIINNSSRGCYIDPFSPNLLGDPIPALKWEDSYKYLGVKVSRVRSGQVDALMDDVLSVVDRILASKLTNWQKVDAINTFALSKLSFQLSSASLNRSCSAKFDALVRQRVKKSLHLPKRSISSFFHLPTKLGGLGLMSVEDSLEAAMISKAIKCLSSKDKWVNDVAWDQLQSTIAKRRSSSPQNISQVLEFINNPPPRGESCRGDVRSLWSMVRRSLIYLNCSVLWEDDRLILRWEDFQVQAGRWKALANLLSDARASRRLRLVKSASDQGRSFHLISLDPSSNHWIPSGAFLSIADHRFATRARLNLLPTKTVVKRAGKPWTITTCPKCKRNPETLAHVLNSCLANSGLMRERHNTILKRIVKATSSASRSITSFKERKIPGSPGDLRPDYCLIDRPHGFATIVDVTIPFEGDAGSFQRAREEKDWLMSEGFVDVMVDAFIVGSLGTWDPDNATISRRLGIRASYSKLFKKLCVSDAIKGSALIWRSKSSRPP